MAKKNEIVNVTTPPGALVVPGFLANQPIQGMDIIKNYVTPPRLKIIQKQSADELQDKHGKGATILLPDSALFAARGTPFVFTPVFMYPEYITWSKIEDRTKVGAIIDRSLDPMGKIAAMASNPKTRKSKMTVPGAGELEVKHVEHLNFLIAVHDHPMTERGLICMSFSKGEHKSGRRLADLIKMRRASPFACIFTALVSAGDPRSNTAGTWFGWDIDNPPEGTSPWVTEAQHELFKKLFTEAADKHKAGLLLAQYDDDDAPAASGGETGASEM